MASAKKTATKAKPATAKKTVKMAIKKTAAKKPVAKKMAPKKAIAAKTAIKKIAIKKTAGKAVKKTSATKKTAAKKPAAKKPAAKKPAAKKAAAKAKAEPKGPLGIPELLRDAALKVLDERQAEEIVMVPLIGRSSVADYMILASARASRQVTAIAEYLREAFFKIGVRQVRIEGMGEANWVLVDAGDVIIHLFRPEVRTYYDLDAMWNDKRAQK